MKSQKNSKCVCVIFSYFTTKSQYKRHINQVHETILFNLKLNYIFN